MKGYKIDTPCAIRCLDVLKSGKIHSFVAGFGIPMGCDLETEAAVELMMKAEESQQLFLLEENAMMGHQVCAFDHKNEDWTYLETKEEIVASQLDALDKNGDELVEFA